MPAYLKKKHSYQLNQLIKEKQEQIRSDQASTNCFSAHATHPTSSSSGRRRRYRIKEKIHDKTKHQQTAGTHNQQKPRTAPFCMSKAKPRSRRSRCSPSQAPRSWVCSDPVRRRTPYLKLILHDPAAAAFYW